MADSRYFLNAGAISLGQIATLSGASLQGGKPDTTITDVAPLDKATKADISFFDNGKYKQQFIESSAGACFVREQFVPLAPAGMALLVTPDPYRAYALTAQAFYPREYDCEGISERAHIDPTATIGDGTAVAMGACIGPDVVIGKNCIIGANAVLMKGVQIGDGTRIDANATLSHCIIGSHCIIHRGVAIGQDGFGFAMGAQGHAKVPQLGRVIVEDHVEIGANSCIDRGAGPDTVVGAGTKIDNLVQIGHNVKVGKACIIVSQSGISGSTVLGNGVVVGGQVGIAGHLKIGDGTILAARSGVSADLEGKKTYGGLPAVAINDWHRQVIALNRLSKKKTAE